MFASVVVIGALSAALPAQEASKAESPQPRWRLRGCVIDEESKPIAGAAIAIGGEALTTADALENPRTRSAADGCFEIDFVEPALGEQLRVLFGDKGRMSVRLDCDRHLASCVPGGEVDLGPIPLPRAITLRGTVRSKTGDPIHGARVVATDLLGLALGAERGPRADLEYVSFGITDNKGIVVLPGIAATGARTIVRADGYYMQEIPVLAHGDPLNVALEPGGFVEGVVLGADGKPCSAHVHVAYEVDGRHREPGVWCADGRFRINLLHPHRYRVSAIYGDGDVGSISDVLDGPARGVEVRSVRKAPARDAGLTLRVLDARSGAAVEAIAAVLKEQGPLQASRYHIERAFARDAVRSRTPGEILLLGPGEGEASTGAVVVRARGYAQQIIRDVHWSGPSRLEVKLVPESSLAGVVVDQRTGEPVEGATVILDGEWGLDWSELTSQGRLTDKDGKFRIGGIGAGTFTLRAWLVGRSISEVVDVEVAASAERSGLRLAIPRGPSFSGHLIGGKVPPGSRLVLRLPRGVRPASSIYVDLHSGEEFVDAGGGFMLPSVVPGESEVELLVPHRQWRGGRISVRLATVDIPQSVEAQKDLDIGGVIFGSIRGVVKFSGPSCVRERLMVRAEAEESYDVVAEPVANDWTFRIPAAADSHRLQVVDLATGVVLAVSEPIRVEGTQPVDVELSQDLARVRVRLEPEDPGQPIVAEKLEVGVKHDLPARRGDRENAFLLFGDGISLADGRREVEVLLPTVPTRLRVRSNAREVLGGLSWQEEEPLGELQLTPEGTGTQTVVIKVRAPTKSVKDKK